jgi:hypothetical protein
MNELLDKSDDLSMHVVWKGEFNDNHCYWPAQKVNSSN